MLVIDEAESDNNLTESKKSYVISGMDGNEDNLKYAKSGNQVSQGNQGVNNSQALESNRQPFKASLTVETPLPFQTAINPVVQPTISPVVNPVVTKSGEIKVENVNVENEKKVQEDVNTNNIVSNSGTKQPLQKKVTINEDKNEGITKRNE